MGTSDFNLEVNGSGFTTASKVQWNGSPLDTHFLTSEQLLGTLPYSLLANPGLASITVISDGARSNSVDFIVSSLAVSSVSPGLVDAEGPGFTLAISGSGFAPGTRVSWEGRPLAASVVSESRIEAAVPAALIASPGTFSIQVTNPDGTSAGSAVRVVPRIDTVDPSSPEASNSDLTVTVTGAGFAAGNSLYFYRGSGGTEPLRTTIINSKTLTAVIPASIVSTFGRQGKLIYGVLSPSLPFPYPVTGKPSLRGVYPCDFVRGAPGLTIRVGGDYFRPRASVWWNENRLDTTDGDIWQVTADVPARLIADVGSVGIRLVNSDGVSTPAVGCQVHMPDPSVSSVVPSSLPAGGPAFTIFVNGANFLPGAVVRLLGKPLPTTFIDSTQLTAAMPAGLSVQGGITVINPDGRTSKGSIDFSPLPPRIWSTVPDVAFEGGKDFTLTLKGANFAPSSVVSWKGTPLATTFLAENRLSSIVPGSLIGPPGMAVVTVSTGGASSGTGLVWVKPMMPWIVAASPDHFDAGGPDHQIVLSGRNFVEGSTARLAGNWIPQTRLATEYVSATELRLLVPAALTEMSGRLAITVENPDGSSSNQFRCDVRGVIEAVRPSYAEPGSADVPLLITGAGFHAAAMPAYFLLKQPSAPVEPLVGNALTSRMIRTVVYNRLLKVAGEAWIGVPDDTGFVALPFRIGIAGLDSLEPRAVEAGTPDFTLAAKGVGFAPGSVVKWNGNPLATNQADSTLLMATVPASLVASADVVNVSVGAPGGEATAPLRFVVNPSRGPSIREGGIVNAASYETAIAPGSLVSIFGSDLAQVDAAAEVLPLPVQLRGVSVLINGVPAPLLYVSPNQINAVVVGSYAAPSRTTAKLVVRVGELSSVPVEFDVSDDAPGVFSDPKNKHAVAQNQPDWGLNSPANPARPGQYVTVYLTNGRKTDCLDLADGAPAPADRLCHGSPVTASVGGRPAEVAFAGLVPGFVWLTQVNLLVPEVSPGEQLLEVRVGEAAANATFLSIGGR